MKIIFFDVHSFEKDIFQDENRSFRHQIDFLETRLTTQTAPLAKGYACVCSFANDRLTSECLSALKENGVQLIALRSAGFNHVDLKAAKELNLKVVRVPEYSPYSVAEFAVCLILSLNRKIHRAHQRVRELNFSLDGLVGYDLHGKTVGVVGTGRIGRAFIDIMVGFGCKILAFDLMPDPKLVESKKVQYVELSNIWKYSDIISLHLPLNPSTRHLINENIISEMKDGVVIINTGRGALIDALALIQGLKSGKVSAAGLDVYEEEENIFFHNLSDQILQDDILARLLTFPNVLITSHQAFLTQEALHNIAQTTLQNVHEFENDIPLTNEIRFSPQVS